MNAPAYLAQLAQQLSCIYVPKCTTFKNDVMSNQKGAVIGARKGYLVALALTRTGNHRGFAIMVRFPASAAAAQIQEALKAKPGFSSFLNKKAVKTTDKQLMISWVYAVTKPKLEEVVSLLDAVLEEVSRYAHAFGGKCEDCGTAETREITLTNGVPGYVCMACRMRIAAEKRREAEEYRAKDANYGLGIVAGVVAAAVAGTAWGELLGWMEAGSKKWYPQLHAVGAFAVSLLVFWALFKAVGKRDRVGQVMAVVLTLAGKWWGDALYFSHVVAQAQEIPMTAALVVATVKDFFAFKFVDGLHTIVSVCDVVFAVMVPWTPWGRLPKFEPVFQTINPDGSLNQTQAQGAGA